MARPCRGRASRTTLAAMADDLADEYQQYLTRFDAALGAVDVGAFAKHKGKLIKKLDLDEFGAKSK